jgi:hypothetical protein
MDSYLEKFSSKLRSMSGAAFKITKMIETNQEFQFSAEFLHDLDTATSLIKELNRRMGR